MIYFYHSSLQYFTMASLSPHERIPVVIRLCLKARIGLWEKYYYAVFDIMHYHSTKKPVTTMLTYPWKCTVLHCNHLGNTWKPLVLMTRHFDYCPSASDLQDWHSHVTSKCTKSLHPDLYALPTPVCYLDKTELISCILNYGHEPVHARVRESNFNC